MLQSINPLLYRVLQTLKRDPEFSLRLLMTGLDRLKTERSRTAGYSGVVTVNPEVEGNNVFSLEIPAGRLSVGSYRIIAQAVPSQASFTGTITVSLKENVSPTSSPGERDTGDSLPSASPDETVAELTPEITPEVTSTASVTIENLEIMAVPTAKSPGMGIPDHPGYFPHNRDYNLWKEKRYRGE